VQFCFRNCSPCWRALWMHVKILVWCKGRSSCFWSHVLIILPRQKSGRQWDLKCENVCKSSSGGNVTFSFSTWCVSFVTKSWQDPNVWNLCVEYQKLGNQMLIFLMKSMKPVPSLVTRQDCRCAAILCQTMLKRVLILFQHVKDICIKVHSAVGNSYGLVLIKHREDLENYAFLLYYALWNWQGCWVLVGSSWSRNCSLNRNTPSHQLWILNNCRNTNCSQRCVFDLKESNICEVCCGGHLKLGDMRWVETSFAICSSRVIACFQP
jgi:hypothetical protein